MLDCIMGYYVTWVNNTFLVMNMSNVCVCTCHRSRFYLRHHMCLGDNRFVYVG